MMEKSLLFGIHSPQIISNPNIQNCFKRDHVILGAHNKTLHLTAIPLRSIAAGELGRYDS